jgi:hypothetical protein
VTETLTTLWLVALAVASFFFVGLPITQAVVRGEDRRDLFWVAAPLLGLSGIVLAAQNLVYWNVPVRHSAGWLWLLAGVLFAWWCIRCRAAVPRPPSSPMLLIWPVLIERVLSDPRWHTVASAAIVLAAANAIYTELTPLFVALGIAQWGWRAGRGPGWWARSLAVPACLAGALVLNPWFAEGTWATVNRTAVPGILSHVYPFAISGEGVMRMWSASDYRSRRHSARTSTRPRTTTLGEAPVA